MARLRHEHQHRKRPSERKRPGRKPGEAYAKKARRLPPGDVDVAVELPRSCPRCGEDLSAVEPDKWYEQFQEELVAQVLRRRYLVASGRRFKLIRPGFFGGSNTLEGWSPNVSAREELGTAALPPRDEGAGCPHGP